MGRVVSKALDNLERERSRTRVNNSDTIAITLQNTCVDAHIQGSAPRSRHCLLRLVLASRLFFSKTFPASWSFTNKLGIATHCMFRVQLRPGRRFFLADKPELGACAIPSRHCELLSSTSASVLILIQVDRTLI